MKKIKLILALMLLMASVSYSQEKGCCEPIDVLFYGQVIPNGLKEYLAIMSGQGKISAFELNRQRHSVARVNPFGYYQITVPSCDIIVIQPNISGKGIEGYGRTVFDIYTPAQGFYDFTINEPSHEVQTDFLLQLITLGQ